MPIKASANKKANNKKSLPKPKKLSAVQKAKNAKRKRSIIYSAIATVSFLFLLGFGYYLGTQEDSRKAAKLSGVADGKIFKQLEKSQAQLSDSTIRYDEAGFNRPDIISRLIKKQEERSKARREQERQKTKNEKPKVALVKGKRPKLAIIIDDISQSWQLKSLKSLELKITPSIFPPSAQSKNSHKLAQGLKHFLIHLPMQSGNAKLDRMWGMLKITDSESQMKARAKEIRKLFPHAVYVNNHTGSVFTANYKATKKMYGYLRDEGFIFMDSRTTGKSKVKRVAREFGDQYIVRDIFIDNTQSVAYIHKQLKKAVKIAKRRGYAIAIGHPHRVTFKALAKAGSILKGVELVYIDELYK